MRNLKRGFSLLELAVALAVMGLLVSAVLGAQSLRETAALRGVVAEVERARVGIYHFYDQYGSMPGDLANATSFWPSPTHTVTNGNNNGRIDNSGTPEFYATWEQLVLAGLMPGPADGSAAGIFSGTGSIPEINVNVPRSNYFHNVGISVDWLTSPPRSPVIVGNYIVVGTKDPVDNASSFLTGGAFTGLQAAEIDEKIDNRLPEFESVLSANSLNGPGECVSGAAYNTTSTTKDCLMFFMLAKDL
jgi:prepilin-type N-terminal cleavage/methylation domain-containing protein